MSRGRARHQASRRRMYSPRQRALRERRLRAAAEGDGVVADEMTALEIDDGTELGDVEPLRIHVRRGASAA